MVGIENANLWNDTVSDVKSEDLSRDSKDVS